MSSLFDVPLQLVVLLSLAVSGSGSKPVEHVQAKQPAAVSALKTYGLDEQSWLAALKSGAGGSELAPHRTSVFRTTNGRYYVPAAAERNRLAALARDPEVVALVVLDSARRNAAVMTPRIGRPVTAGELYVAHVLGADTAIALITVANSTPDVSASKVHPRLAAVAPAMKGKDGRTMTAAQLLDRLTWAFPPASAEHAADAVVSATSADSPPLPHLAMRGPSADLPGITRVTAPLIWSAEVHGAP